MFSEDFFFSENFSFSEDFLYYIEFKAKINARKENKFKN